MSGRSKALVIGALVLLVGLGVWQHFRNVAREREEGEKKAAEEKRWKESLASVEEIDAELARLKPVCLKLPAGTPARRQGRAVYWPKPEPNFPALEAERKEQLAKEVLAGGEFTIVWPAEEVKTQVRTYFPNIPGYKVDQTVCLFDWPGKQPVAWAVVEGEWPEPEVVVGKGQQEVYGRMPVREWVEKLTLAGNH